MNIGERLSDAFLEFAARIIVGLQKKSASLLQAAGCAAEKSHSTRWQVLKPAILAAAILLTVAVAMAQTNSPPRLGAPELLTNGVVRLMILDGAWGQTNVVEASTNLVDWTPISTNVFPPSLCPICPFIVFDDTVTNAPSRFYRARNLPQ